MTPPDTREQARATAHELLSLGPDCMNHWVGDHAACDTMVNYILARDAAHAAEVERLHELTAAYLTDRADQYDTKSPCWVALTDEAEAVINGEVEAADANGDLDDELLARVRKWRRK